MNQSEDIKELVGALSKAQAVMKPAAFNRVNPHFKNRYADFTSCIDTVREPLATNGLSVMQYCETINEKLMLVTMLAHVSGQWIKSYFPLNPLKQDSQSIGSAMTYGKRYSLSAMLGIVSDDEDDDGESSHGRGAPSNEEIERLKNEVTRLQNEVVQARCKVTANEATILKSICNDLDEERKGKVMLWLLSQVSRDNFAQVNLTLENAYKHMLQEQKEKASEV